jgi:hypothetical protein
MSGNKADPDQIERSSANTILGRKRGGGLAGVEPTQLFYETQTTTNMS